MQIPLEADQNAPVNVLRMNSEAVHIEAINTSPKPINKGAYCYQKQEERYHSQKVFNPSFIQLIFFLSLHSIFITF